MKKALVAAVALTFLGSGGSALAQGTGAPMLDRGTQELGISGNLDFEDADGNLFLDLNGSYGYFVQDNLELGASISYLRRDGGDFEEVGIGGFGELHFPVSNLTVPYVGVGLDYSHTDVDIAGVDQDDDDAFVVSPRVGVKWFVREYVAIDTNVFFKWASEDLFVNDGDLEETDWGAQAGLRVFFK